ncbi:hypothetical protein [uncultured Arsenicicoccus sp.]|uniref:hypothetical protein n=1 Tax=uncultured Arsenicicoccus sp. TaxID=491339 RepID=UPI002597D611|nr:hypothetical protein [uncultured Arsenicicoccus sp.]
MTPALRGEDIPRATGPHQPTGRRWRCLILGCPQYAEWQPTVHGREGIIHRAITHPPHNPGEGTPYDQMPGDQP